jgi:hypothetical protein
MASAEKPGLSATVAEPSAESGNTIAPSRAKAAPTHAGLGCRSVRAPMVPMIAIPPASSAAPNSSVRCSVRSSTTCGADDRLISHRHNTNAAATATSAAKETPALSASPVRIHPAYTERPNYDHALYSEQRSTEPEGYAISIKAVC